MLDIHCIQCISKENLWHIKCIIHSIVYYYRSPIIFPCNAYANTIFVNAS
ncbi:hypothetical protein HMPREF0083_05476 [Aneurinibacillus aneurinilyticus ATCC 12856]|uniref:Uncharacterized protein n=1 Tax=Aneurinibacillus aneurinilyticus ATCC 12856 TaxID=649747 RepID=U1WBK1_ANEAE|nr:hypothetical protein HMPREF0083_05476 [Aneurinibacillus aneurinilyticus ATCC 12856]